MVSPSMTLTTIAVWVVGVGLGPDGAADPVPSLVDTEAGAAGLASPAAGRLTATDGPGVSLDRARASAAEIPCVGPRNRPMSAATPRIAATPRATMLPSRPPTARGAAGDQATDGGPLTITRAGSAAAGWGASSIAATTGAAAIVWSGTVSDVADDSDSMSQKVGTVS